MSLDYLRGWKASFVVSTRKLSHWALGRLWRVKNGLSHRFRLHTCCGLAVPWFAGALNHHFIPLQEVTVHSEVSHMSHPQGAVGTLELTSRCCSGAEHLLTVERPPFQMRGSHFVCQLHLPHLSWRDPTSVFGVIGHPLIRDTPSHLLERTFLDHVSLINDTEPVCALLLFYLRPNFHNNVTINFCRSSENNPSKHKILGGLSLTGYWWTPASCSPR